MGLLCLDANQHDHAIEWIARAIRQDAKAEYLTSLGTALQQQGRHEEALKAFDKAVQLKPDVGELWKNLGNVLLDLKRPDDALLSFQHALKLDPAALARRAPKRSAALQRRPLRGSSAPSRPYASNSNPIMCLRGNCARSR